MEDIIYPDWNRYKHDTFIYQVQSCIRPKKRVPIKPVDWIPPVKPLEKEKQQSMRLDSDLKKKKKIVLRKMDAEIELQLLTDILRIPSIKRRSDDVASTVKLLKGKGFCPLYSDFMLQEICKCMTLETYESNAIVFRQGDYSTGCFIIWRGSAEIWVKDQINNVDGLVTFPFSVSSQTIKEQSKKIGQVTMGQVFGELSIINNAPRSASIITSSECYILRIPREGKLFYHEF
jgi:hypothetical protein